MNDGLERRKGKGPGGSREGELLAQDWDRLEEVGDLHFQAGAFSSALDYYRRLLEAEHHNLPAERVLTALRKCVEAAIKIGNQDLAEALLQRAEETVDRLGDLDPESRGRLRAPLMGRRASLLMQRSAYRQALHAAKHAFAILAITDAHAEVANLQLTMGACYHRLGRLEKAEELYTDALSTYRRIEDEIGTAALYNNLALLHKNACRWDEALALIAKASALALKHGATHLLPRLSLNRGIVLAKIGRFEEARVALEKSLRLARSLGDRARQAKICLALGGLEIRTGRLARAEELIYEGKAIAEQERFLREDTIADEYLGDILLARQEFEKALFSYGVGLEKSRTLGKVNDLEGELLRRSAEAERLLGRLDESVASGLAAIAVCEKCGELYEVGFCHRTLGLAHAERDRWDEVDSHFAEAIAVFRRQNLAREWIQTILDYWRVRLDSAGQPELLLLKRHLQAAQESAGGVDGERFLGRVLAALAEVQRRLGQFDDALLTVYELERVASGLEDGESALAVGELRHRIESGLLGTVEGAGTHVQAMGRVPGLLGAGDGAIPRNLSSVLQAGMEKVLASGGFIAMLDGGNDLPRIVAREGLSENLAGQLARWYAADREGSLEPRLYTRLHGDHPLLRAVPALDGEAASCIFLPIALEERLFGLLFLAKDVRRAARTGFGHAELDFLATYMGFLALFLAEKSRARLPGAADRLPTPLEDVESFENVITRSETMLDVLGLIRKVAPSDLTVLLKGETGTGKGLLAYSIHALSRRRSRKFLSINCAAIPETLLESELFGHMKGSFTGAHADKRGLLAEAEGGTVFLDEIGKMPLSMQGKLLHFLDTKIVRPVGSAQERRVDVRIVCASKGDLNELAGQGLFLEDLYYRLLDFPLDIPPLRQRRDDIPLLSQHFIRRFSQELEIEAPACGTATLDALVQYEWPGNVRELEKTLKRAIVLARGERTLRPEHLPAAIVGFAPAVGRGEQVPPLRETLAAVEAREIAQALQASGGNKAQASRLLRISYPNLLKKIKYYGIRLD